MTEWNIEMTIYKDNKIIGFKIDVDGLSNAKQAVLHEFKKHSQQKNIYLEANHKGDYIIVSDLIDVGRVKIERNNSC